MMSPSRIRLTQLLKRAVAEGQLAADLDLDLAVALLLGPMMYHHVIGLSNSRVPEEMPRKVVESFWKAHSAADPVRDRERSSTKPTVIASDNSLRPARS
jgi:Tetracyclin repressor-like, C-terminal domain